MPTPPVGDDGCSALRWRFLQASRKELQEAPPARFSDRAERLAQMARELLFNGFMEHLMLKPLPYDSHALEPHISRETVTLHYTKHHVGYAKKLSALVAGKPEETASLEWMIRRSEGAIFNNAAQIWNHDFYWRSMQPAGGGTLSGPLKAAVNNTFGSFERLRDDFLAAGADHFGSGWLWLVSRGDSLRVTTTPDADLPTRHGDTPILCADLWEHAYYLDYHDERKRYLEAFIDHLVNWEFAGANWNQAAASARSQAAASAPLLRRASLSL